MSEKLDTITARFGRVYDRASKAKQSLAKRQKEMFEAFTQELEKQPLARRSVPYPVGMDLGPWVKKYHPGWRSVDASKDGLWLILEEDPAFAKFAYVNPVTKEVYARTMVEGSPGLDDEALRAEQPALWERITEWPEPWKSLVGDVIQRYMSLRMSPEALEGTVGRFLRERGIQRVLKDFSRLSDEDIMDLQDYFIPGQISTRLVPPREAKPEELEHVETETRDQEHTA